MRRLSQDEFFRVSIGQRPCASRTQLRRFPGVRETRETRRRLSACVRVRDAHFEHELWQF